MSRTKFRVAIGSVAAAAIVGGALTTAYADPFSNSSNSSNSSSSSWSPNIATSTTTLKDVSSTMASNGDKHPAGVATVPRSVGHLVRGDVLVVNSSNKSGLSGTGASVMQINPSTGQKSLFAWLTPSSLPSTCPGGIGLTNAVVLSQGWVVLTSMPSSNGSWKNAKGGCLIVLNSLGHAKVVIAGSWLNGPGGITSVVNGNNVQLFVTSVLNGTSGHWGQVRNTATVIRIDLTVTQQTFRLRNVTVIAVGLPTRISTTGFLTAPIGLVVVKNTLFIVDPLNNRVVFVNFATTRHFATTIVFVLTRSSLMRTPLTIILFHNVLIVANGGNGNVIAVSFTGRTSLIKALDTTAVSGMSPGAGALWGMATSSDGKWIYYADAMDNNLSVCGPLSS
jgi:hypothetical protein